MMTHSGKSKWTKVLALTMAMALPVAVLTEQRSEAIIAIAARNSNVGVISGLSLIGGTSAGVAAAVYLAVNTVGGLSVALSSVTLGSSIFIGAAIMAGLGLLVLDGSGQGALGFKALDPAKDAARLGVSVQAIETYNLELDELNVLSQSVEQDLTSGSGAANLEKSKNLWESYAVALQPETLEVAKKVASGFVDAAYKSLNK